jgi:hypothetical protein
MASIALQGKYLKTGGADFGVAQAAGSPAAEAVAVGGGRCDDPGNENE